MGISLIGISHQHAPVAVRALFVFSKERQQELMQELIRRNLAEECVMISTCNRTELYTYRKGTGNSFTKIQELLLEFAQAEKISGIGDYIRFYDGSRAVRHLFHVAAGLESAVLGEDQILGQVKRAQELAYENRMSGIYLNTLFRYAVTAAKKVKTKTELSRTSISTATMAVKAVEQGLGTLHGKKVMLIGASGRIGSIVLKNLQCMEGVEVFITSRNFGLAGQDPHHKITYQVMKYEERYELINEMDAVISATSSPHYTLTYEKLAKKLTGEKPRVLVDLAVPMDIEESAAALPGVRRYDMDDFQELARENNEKKQQEAAAADQILEEMQLEFERWMVFQLALPQMEHWKAWMKAETEKKGLDKAIDQMFYRMRDHSKPEELHAFFEQLKEMD